MKTFQIVLLIVFGALAALAVAFFSGAIELPQKKNSSTPGSMGTVVMWGIIPRSSLATTVEAFNKLTNNQVNLVYVQKDQDKLEKELLESFAFGVPPDVFLLSNDLISLYHDKVVLIPYQGFSERMFTDSYIQASDVFKTLNGILGFPILSDPLIMFYNKDHLESKNIIKPPVLWKDLLEITPILTEKNEVLDIKRSAVALGESKNINNFREILFALNLQLGNNISFRDNEKKVYVSNFSGKSLISSKPAEESLRFYTEFSNPLKTVYSWNKSKQSSLNSFIAGDLSIYFGFASEIPTIQRMNPNLNFDIANIPQIEGSSNRITYSRVYALAIPKTTKNFQGAFYVASQLANGPLTAALPLSSGMAPVRRDLLSSNQTITKYVDVFYKSALQSRSVIEPGIENSNKVFGDMVESILSGLKDYSKAVDDANRELEILLKR